MPNYDDNDDRHLKKIAHTLEDHRRILGFIHVDIHSLLDAVRDIACTLKRFVPQTPPPGPGDLHAKAGTPVSDLGGSTMPANIIVPKMLDTEKLPLSIMPRKADGHIDNAASPTWVSSDEANVGLAPGTEPFDFEDIKIGVDGVTEEWREVVTCPGNFNCFALTPGASGTGATVTVSAAGYDSAVFGPFEYAQGVARSLNASVGAATSDAEL